MKTILIYMPVAMEFMFVKVFTSFMEMIGEDVREKLAERGYKLKFYFSKKFPIDLNRNEAFDICTSSKYEADLIMCCDGDQAFKKDTLLKLLDTLEENPEVNGVTGVYFTKSYPHRAVVGKYSPWNTTTEPKRESLKAEGFVGPDGNQTLYFKHLQYFDVVQPVDVFGLGCLLLKTEVFKLLKQPFCKYVNPYTTGGDYSFLGHSEDMWFCSQLKQAGAKILVNPKVMVGHITTKVIAGNESEE